MQSYSRIRRGPVCSRGAVGPLGKVQRHFLLSLILQTEALQEPRWLGILHGLDLCLCILHGPGLCLCIFVGHPSLELLEQGFGWWLRISGLTLIGGVKGGSNFGARRRLPCSWRQSLNTGGRLTY